MNIRTRIIACLCVLSILLSLIVLSQVIGDLSHDPEYTTTNEGIAATTGVYYMENWNELGRLYLVNTAGDVLAMADSGETQDRWIRGFDVGNDHIYTIYEAEVEGVNSDYRVYRIAAYDPYLMLLQCTEPFILDSVEQVKSLDHDSEKLYITTIGSEGSTVNVYEIGKDSLLDIKDAGLKTGIGISLDMTTYDKPLSIVYRENEGGRFFVDAYYNGSDVVLMQDGDKTTGRFAPDMRVKAAVDRMHFNLIQQMSLYANYLTWWLGGLIIWFILMGIIYRLLRRRNRSVYAFVMAEILFLTIITICFYFIYREYKAGELRQNVRYGVLAMRQQLDYMEDMDNLGFDDPNFYDSDGYRNMVAQLRRYLQSGHNKVLFEDFLVMDTRSGVIAVDAEGYARVNASYVYGGAMTSLLDQLKAHKNIANEAMRLNDSYMVAIGMPDDDPSVHYALVTICHTDADKTIFWSHIRSVLLAYAITLIIGSAIVALIYYLQHADLRAFEHAIGDVALGRTKIDIPQTPAQDIRSMWNSLSEITKRMEEISYDKFRIFEAYYRFAPKNIETIMGKDSIFDVNNGDTTNVEGTLMLLSTNGEGFGEKKVKSLTNIMMYMSQFTDDQEGILVSQDSSMSELRFFFLRDFVQTIARATQLLHRNTSDEGAEFVSGFLYDDSFIYGVAGIKAQSLCFITSPNSKEMEEYAVWFSSLRVPLVVTDEVVKREDAGQTRYIGYIVPSTGRRIDLYEVIDAESARLRQIKLTTREKFEETLQLFYSREYYLARNRFSEILKECPEDELAKWYLFESERYLNGEIETTAEGALRISE